MSIIINPVPLIKELGFQDKKTVKALYYKNFPNAAKSRFNECCWSGNFSAIEKNYLMKLFILQDENYVLDYSDELIEQIDF